MSDPHADPIFLSHCGLSPLYPGSRNVMNELINVHTRYGDRLFKDHYIQELDLSKKLFAQYLHTEPE
ncbi:MAG TPA: hypothetical protein VKZ56_02280, partial [Membranihabitans sp.]|nr:hypothetical protein [Membranihabitans sp.]